MLRHPYRDGTTRIVLEPLAFLGRLAVLVPRPRVNLPPSLLRDDVHVWLRRALAWTEAEGVRVTQALG